MLLLNPNRTTTWRVEVNSRIKKILKYLLYQQIKIWLASKCSQSAHFWNVHSMDCQQRFHLHRTTVNHSEIWTQSIRGCSIDCSTAKAAKQRQSRDVVAACSALNAFCLLLPWVLSTGLHGEDCRVHTWHHRRWADTQPSGQCPPGVDSWAGC